MMPESGGKVLISSTVVRPTAEVPEEAQNRDRAATLFAFDRVTIQLRFSKKGV